MKPSQTAHVTRPGENHTGAFLHPDLIAEMIQGTTEFGPTTTGGPELISERRIQLAKTGVPVGTMPPSPDIPIERLALLDRLGARLAFERMGVRLYEALIAKHDAYGLFGGGPSRGDLELIRDQERDHMMLAQQMIVGLGGDPTVVTPCANLQAVASRGIADVLVDPRTTLIECLDAILIVELADHDSWEQLAVVTNAMGESKLEEQIRKAELTEAEHIAKVRNWVTSASKLVTRATD